MICPSCHSEYRDGFTHCTNCDVDLVPSPPASASSDERGNIELVNVFETGNPAIISLLESLFKDGGIDFSTSSEGLQDLFAGGRLGGGFNYAIGPVMFYVRREDEADARAIVATLGEPLPALDSE